LPSRARYRSASQSPPPPPSTWSATCCALGAPPMPTSASSPPRSPARLPPSSAWTRPPGSWSWRWGTAPRPPGLASSPATSSSASTTSRSTPSRISSASSVSTARATASPSLSSETAANNRSRPPWPTTPTGSRSAVRGLSPPSSPRRVPVGGRPHGLVALQPRAERPPDGGDRAGQPGDGQVVGPAGRMPEVLAEHVAGDQEPGSGQGGHQQRHIQAADAQGNREQGGRVEQPGPVAGDPAARGLPQLGVDDQPRHHGPDREHG